MTPIEPSMGSDGMTRAAAMLFGDGMTQDDIVRRYLGEFDSMETLGRAAIRAIHDVDPEVMMFVDCYEYALHVIGSGEVLLLGHHAFTRRPLPIVFAKAS